MVLIINDEEKKEEKNVIKEGKSKEEERNNLKSSLENILKEMYAVDKHIQRREVTISIKKIRNVERELEKIINGLGWFYR